MVRAATWLSVTPEPERELPAAVATLVYGCVPQASAVAAETARIERLILRGSQRAWLRYLHRVVELIDSRSASRDADVQLARERALDVIANHHNLLLGLRGRGAELTASDRARLSRILTGLTEPEGEP
jgi:hypothetical protein